MRPFNLSPLTSISPIVITKTKVKMYLLLTRTFQLLLLTLSLLSGTAHIFTLNNTHVIQFAL